MLSIAGPATASFCDRISRRNMLRIGALGLGGLTLPGLLRADAARAAETAAQTNSQRANSQRANSQQTNSQGRAKSIINIILSGGLSHLDSFDMKPDAPNEIRGTFDPISTNVTGVQVCEHLPRVARHLDKLAVLRSLYGFFNEHKDNQADSGWTSSSLGPIGGRPGMGAVVSKLLGPAAPCPIPSVSMGTKFLYNSALTSPGFLGPRYRDFEPYGIVSQFASAEADKHSDMQKNLRMNLPAPRFRERRSLLGQFEALRRGVASSAAVDSADLYTQKAFDVILSGSLASVLDLTAESAKTREAYGITGDRDEKQNFLLARRLVEAGVRVVSFQFSGWDTHYDNFGELKRKLPQLDVALSGLLADLHDRGLLDETIVMVSTEFGRTPRIAEEGAGRGPGRSHWPSAGCYLLAGGGLRTGQVIGSTNRLGERPEDRPVHLQEVFATIYRQLGIDVETVQLQDTFGRPYYLLEHKKAIHELV